MNMQELLNKKEELHPELEECVYALGSEYSTISGMLTLKHPFAVHVPYMPEMNALINRGFSVRKKMFAEYVQRKNYGAALMLVEKPFRLTMLLEMQVDFAMSDIVFWKLAAEVWIGSENVYENREEWDVLFAHPTTSRKLMMNAAEKREWNRLPDHVSIFRGAPLAEHHEEEYGLSWTTDRKKAIWFAQRFGSHRGESVVLCAVVQRQNFSALFLGRNEREVVILPKYLGRVVARNVEGIN